MEAYTDFASVYDLFMEDTPYEEWADRIEQLLAEYDEKKIPDDDDGTLASEAGLVVDLGCGTGKMTRLLSAKGHDMIGIDASYEMLEVARSATEAEGADKAENAVHGIMYLEQDMRELELYSTVGAVISVCDCVNYLLTEEDLLRTFKLVNNYLYPRGLFIFDFNTVHKYCDVIGDTTIAETRDEGSFIWDNFYDEETHINEYDLTIYMKPELLSGNPAGPSEQEFFVRTQETHVQRGYELNEMTDLVKQAGLELVCAFDSDTDGPVSNDTERICLVAREVTKESK